MHSIGGAAMKTLSIGERVCINAGIPAFWHCIGRIVDIIEPFVTDEAMKARALFEMRLYSVRLDDGRKFRFRGQDLEPVGNHPITSSQAF
jgi:hypothetical protein